MTRLTIESELGKEIQCAKCKEFWPLDSDFFFITRGKPHSWCKACYMADPKIIEKRERWRKKVAKGVRPESSDSAFTFLPGFPFAA